MEMILIGGLWLTGSAWREVVPVLERRGHHPRALNLPGQGDGATTADLEDQLGEVVAAVDATEGPAMVVGHSASATLAWMAADARPHGIAGVVMIGGFPSGDGGRYFDSLPVEGEWLEFPGWDEFEGPDAADLSAAQRTAIEAEMVPVPAAVVRATVHLRNPRRFEVPVTIVCPEFSATQAKVWVDGGEVPELARLRSVDYFDIDSGHWPMFSRPTELGELLGRIADR